jgi:hypothetical protein
LGEMAQSERATRNRNYNKTVLKKLSKPSQAGPGQASMQIRVARFFLVQTYLNKKIPNDHKLYQKAIHYIYQMAVKYSKWS